ncbi:MAG: hypothetical protein RBR99_00060 [Dehalococcoidales bacterium]|jgi:hypothetical protein|nr:hypothetical protein [Dehalococcoidales bacterium]MDX9985841.1 hypothetical protein [Dehalococcoidales bacterium]NLE89841.1 hypothetical protein [Dehalococcoidales bacterium]
MIDPNKELIQLLKEINEKLDVIKYDLKDVKNAMPKVPYYGDMLQDITRAVQDIDIKK